jgi:hypothetical protein
LSAEHGNGQPDLLLSAEQLLIEIRSGACSSEPHQPPIRHDSDHPRDPNLPFEAHICLNHEALVCEDGITFCTHPPQSGKCFCSCIPPAIPHSPLGPRGCRLETRFPPLLMLVAHPGR